MPQEHKTLSVFWRRAVLGVERSRNAAKIHLLLRKEKEFSPFLNSRLCCPFRAQFCSVGISIPMALPWAIIISRFQRAIINSQLSILNSQLSIKKKGFHGVKTRGFIGGRDCRFSFFCASKVTVSIHSFIFLKIKNICYEKINSFRCHYGSNFF